MRTMATSEVASESISSSAKTKCSHRISSVVRAVGVTNHSMRNKRAPSADAVVVVVVVDLVVDDEDDDKTIPKGLVCCSNCSGKPSNLTGGCKLAGTVVVVIPS